MRLSQALAIVPRRTILVLACWHAMTRGRGEGGAASSGRDNLPVRATVTTTRHWRNLCKEISRTLRVRVAPSNLAICTFQIWLRYFAGIKSNDASEYSAATPVYHSEPAKGSNDGTITPDRSASE
jgi:hypothetical protein